MAKRLFSRIILTCQQVKPKIIGINGHRNLSTCDVPVKEVQIPLAYGHVAAKLWGNSTERPILALHGWQDNSGTWDTLFPLLYKEMKNMRPILALDLPGHGKSSWLPDGLHYHAWEYPLLITYLKEYFKWDKVSLLAHSMGSIASFRYTTVNPNNVDFYIALDNLIYDDYNLDFVVDKYSVLFNKNYIANKRLHEEPPSYTRKEMIRAWHYGTKKSVNLDSVPYLLERGCLESKKNPGKYYFSRDPRLKYVLFNPEDKKFVEALALRLKCPTLYFKATDSPYAQDTFSVGMREIIEKNNSNFEAHFVPGTHHVHLNNPEIVLPAMINFLRKHG